MAVQQPFVTYAAYAAAELTSEEKHEWHDGIVVAMSGGTLRHGALCARVSGALGNALRTRTCQVFTADVKLRIRATRLGTYPDVSVVCGELEVDTEDRHSLLNPALVVEVLSPSTERYDRGAKFAHYRAIPSLRAVLLVNQDEPKLELFEKQADGSWLLRVATETLQIASLEIELSVPDLYRSPLPS